MSRPVPAIKISIQRMQCTACGAEANASCNCGKPYAPIKIAQNYVRANPSASVRAVAKETGVSHATAQRAKAAVSLDTPVIGRDGKTYSAKKQQAIADIADGLLGDACLMRVKAQEERDRKECVASAKKASKANRDAMKHGMHLLEITADPPEDGETRQDFWQRSLSNLAGEAISLRAYWTKHFGEWEKFDKPKEIKTLAMQAMAAWADIAAQLVGGEAAEEWQKLSAKLLSGGDQD
jgi:hypothetical protein